MNNYIYENISQMMKYFIGESTLGPYILGRGGKIGRPANSTRHDMKLVDYGLRFNGLVSNFFFFFFFFEKLLVSYSG